jgi:hypothetical protein
MSFIESHVQRTGRPGDGISQVTRGTEIGHTAVMPSGNNPAAERPDYITGKPHFALSPPKGLVMCTLLFHFFPSHPERCKGNPAPQYVLSLGI